MSRLRRNRFSLGVGSEDICIVDATKKRMLSSLPLIDYLPGAASPATADWAPSIEAILAQANVQDGGDLVVNVSDDWARYFVLTLPAGVGSLSEMRMLAAGRFEALFGLSPEGWVLSADWTLSGKILVCAIPARLVDVVYALTKTNQWRIRSIQSYALRLIEAFYKQIPDDCWLCCFSNKSAVALRVSDGSVQYVRRVARAQLSSAEALVAMLEAESLRAGFEMPKHLGVLGMPPAFLENALLGGMRVVVPSGAKVLRARPGKTAESLALAMQGAVA